MLNKNSYEYLEKRVFELEKLEVMTSGKAGGLTCEPLKAVDS